MVTVISRFRVANGMEEAVRQAFLNRPRLVEKATGFRGIEVLTDAADPCLFLLLTRWRDEESFRAWHRSESHHASHVFIPKGLKLDPAFTLLTVGHSIEPATPAETLEDVIASHIGGISEWLKNSEAVFAVLLAPDGTICDLNRSAERVFGGRPLEGANTKLWDYFVCSETENLRRRLSEPESDDDDAFFLNLADRDQSPVTWKARLLRCDRMFILLATLEQRYNSQFQDEILALANDLSMAIRDAAQKNRELKEANDAIALLARTDRLTGLANRRMLEETLPREAARAGRLNESLSVIFVDVDRFKPINDQFGHKAGDQVLAQLGIIFKRQLRSYALASRLGGDEFFCCCREAPKRERSRSPSAFESKWQPCPYRTFPGRSL